MKVLIVRFSSIGDIVLTSPVVRCLKEQGAAEVHFLCKKQFEQTVACNPYIDQLWTIEKEITEVVPALKKEQFDLVIDLHKNLRTLRLKMALGVKHIAFDKLNFKKWLMVNFKINRLPDTHIVNRNLDTLAALNIHYDNKGLDFFYPLDEKENTFSKLQSIGFDYRQKYIALVIGAAHQTKRIPNDKLIQLCQQINQPILLIGGPSEKEDGIYLSEHFSTQVYNACGLLNLYQSAIAIEQAEKVISPDTGMMHIAAAFNKEIFTVWGNTVPEFGMSAFLAEGKRSHNFEVEALNCRPCSKIGFDKCPKGHFNCMNKQKINLLVQKINL